MSEIAEFTRHLGHYLPSPDVALLERAAAFSRTPIKGSWARATRTLVHNQEGRHRIGEHLAVHVRTVLSGMHHEYSLASASA